MSTIRAFMFHDIRTDTLYPKRYNLKSFLNEEQFKFQINLIQKKYKIIDSKDIFDIDLTKNQHNYAVLTFDDGLRDHYWVYNYLKSLNIPATFFIPKMPILKKKVMNSHKIQFILAKTEEETIKNEILDLFDFSTQNIVWEEYSKTSWKNNWWSKEMIFITNFLRKYKDDKINNYEITNFLFDKYVIPDEQSFSEDFYLNDKQICEMVDNGMTIGGHGNISENLLLIDDYKKDINESKDFVLKYSDRLIFSYPNGGYNDDIKEYMSQSGWELSFTTTQKTLTELDNIDFLEFPRYDSPQKIKLP